MKFLKSFSGPKNWLNKGCDLRLLCPSLCLTCILCHLLAFHLPCCLTADSASHTLDLVTIKMCITQLIAAALISLLLSIKNCIVVLSIKINHVVFTCSNPGYLLIPLKSMGKNITTVSGIGHTVVLWSI